MLENTPLANRIGLILLAAGGSTRMGEPKQLLPYRGQSLVRRAAEAALGSECRPILAVVGSAARKVRSEMSGLDVEIIENPEWQCGIGTSIACGIMRLAHAYPDIEAAVIMLCDMPLISSESIDSILRAYDANHTEIVASDYGDGVGVPALFTRSLFPALTELPDGQGAKSFIASYAGSVTRVFSGGAVIDVDTPAEYNALRREEMASRIRNAA